MKNQKLLASLAAAVLVIAVVVVYTGVTSYHKKHDDPQVTNISTNAKSVKKYNMLQLSVGLKADFQNPYDPSQLDLSTDFTSPSGKKWHVFGFYDGSGWKVRFTPNEQGTWHYRITVKDAKGIAHSHTKTFKVTNSNQNGWIEVSKRNHRYFQYDDGKSFYGVGAAYPWNVDKVGLQELSSHGANIYTYWNGNYDGSGDGGGTKQLESIQSGLGKIDEDKAARIDQLIAMSQKQGMHISFVIWPHDSLTAKIDWPKQWKNNPLNTIIDSTQFFASSKSWQYQKNMYRYILARWGYSPTIALWDIVDEIDGTDGWQLGDKKAANEWIQKAQQYFAENDPYHHPTSGSMSGSKQSFWDQGYKTLDVSDREIYFSLDTSAYAEDIQKRWSQYKKPLIIGETGNTSETNKYHNALWVSLANGLAETPIWWDITKVTEPMLEQMDHFSKFATGIDFAKENFKPVATTTEKSEVTLPQNVPLEKYPQDVDWSQAEWAKANKDAAGSIYSPFFTKLAGQQVTETDYLLKKGSFSQGFAEQKLNFRDWSSYDDLKVDLYLQGDHANNTVYAKGVLFPNGTWDEANDDQSMKLVSGQWVTMDVPLSKIPANYWQNAPIKAGQLSDMANWGLKIYSTSIPKDQKIQVMIRNPRLTAAKAPTVMRSDSTGWAMAGDKEVFGWMLSGGHPNISGAKMKVSGLQDGSYQLIWFDTWTGKTVRTDKVNVSGGTLNMKAPTDKQPDIAFKMIKS